MRSCLRLTLFGLVVLASLFLPYIYSRVASQWRRVQLFSPTELQPIAATARRPLRLVSFNIAHGRGNAFGTEN